jgi:predicted TIM-barrel fold metal-dependent hydrolase
MANGLPIIDCNTIFGFWQKRRIDASVDALVGIMKANNVVRALCVSTTAILYDYRIGNEETFQVAQRHGQTLYPVATVDPRQYIDCFNEIDKRLQQGFRFFRFFPEHQDWPIYFAPFRDIINHLGSKGVPMLVPVSSLGDATRLADMVSFLSAPVIISHVNYVNLGEALAVMKNDAKIYLETHMLNSPDVIELAVGEVGVERLVFGSSAPLKYFSSALMPILSSGLNDEQKGAILGGNIRRLLTGK